MILEKTTRFIATLNGKNGCGSGLVSGALGPCGDVAKDTDNVLLGNWRGKRDRGGTSFPSFYTTLYSRPLLIFLNLKFGDDYLLSICTIFFHVPGGYRHKQQARHAFLLVVVFSMLPQALSYLPAV